MKSARPASRPALLWCPHLAGLCRRLPAVDSSNWLRTMAGTVGLAVLGLAGCVQGPNSSSTGYGQSFRYEPAAATAAPGSPYAPNNANATARQIRLRERFRNDADDNAEQASPATPAQQDRADARRAACINPWLDTDAEPQSTFGMDVDTASFTAARQTLAHGQLPPAETVRTEEFVNYFDYSDRGDPRRTFSVNAELTPTPFARGAYLLRIGLRARPVPDAVRKPANLTFVVDVSGSMSPANRLPLVKQALADLVDRLQPDDCVAIVIFSSTSEVVLDLTPVTQHRAIERAIDRLEVGGATSIEDGLTLGYQLARAGFARNKINRVILCTDGEANVGDISPNGILGSIAREKARGIYLTTVGFGLKDTNDRMLETLADKGNGNAAHVDSTAEADRVFGDNLTAMLECVAKDAKIQVEFNPDRVSEYRLIGYEDRAIANRDFRNDRVDAGEVGAGHGVTALYEITLCDRPRQPAATDHRRALRPRPDADAADNDLNDANDNDNADAPDPAPGRDAREARHRADIDDAVDALLDENGPRARRAARADADDADDADNAANTNAARPNPDALCTLRLRWKNPDSPTGATLPDGRESVLEQSFDVTADALSPTLSRASTDLRLSMAAAQLAEILRGSPYAARRDIDAVLALADSVSQDRPNDPKIQDLLSMAEQVRNLLPPPRLSRRDR